MTRGEDQAHSKAQGRTDVAENNRAYWRAIESAVNSGERVPDQIVAEYEKLRRST